MRKTKFHDTDSSDSQSNNDQSISSEQSTNKKTSMVTFKIPFFKRTGNQLAKYNEKMIYSLNQELFQIHKNVLEGQRQKKKVQVHNLKKVYENVIAPPEKQTRQSKQENKDVKKIYEILESVLLYPEEYKTEKFFQKASAIQQKNTNGVVTRFWKWIRNDNLPLFTNSTLDEIIQLFSFLPLPDQEKVIKECQHKCTILRTRIGGSRRQMDRKMLQSEKKNTNVNQANQIKEEEKFLEEMGLPTKPSLEKLNTLKKKLAKLHHPDRKMTEIRKVKNLKERQKMLQMETENFRKKLEIYERILNRLYPSKGLKKTDAIVAYKKQFKIFQEHIKKEFDELEAKILNQIDVLDMLVQYFQQHYENTQRAILFLSAKTIGSLTTIWKANYAEGVTTMSNRDIFDRNFKIPKDSDINFLKYWKNFSVENNQKKFEQTLLNGVKVQVYQNSEKTQVPDIFTFENTIEITIGILKTIDIKKHKAEVNKTLKNLKNSFKMIKSSKIYFWTDWIPESFKLGILSKRSLRGLIQDIEGLCTQLIQNHEHKSENVELQKALVQQLENLQTQYREEIGDYKNYIANLEGEIKHLKGELKKIDLKKRVPIGEEEDRFIKLERIVGDINENAVKVGLDKIDNYRTCMLQKESIVGEGGTGPCKNLNLYIQDFEKGTIKIEREVQDLKTKFDRFQQLENKAYTRHYVFLGLAFLGLFLVRYFFIQAANVKKIKGRKVMLEKSQQELTRANIIYCLQKQVGKKPAVIVYYLIMTLCSMVLFSCQFGQASAYYLLANIIYFSTWIGGIFAVLKKGGIV